MPILHVVAICLLKHQFAPLCGLAQEPEHILLWQVHAQSAQTFSVQHRKRLLFFSINYWGAEQTKAKRGTQNDGYLHVHCGDMGVWGVISPGRLYHVFAPTPKAARTLPALSGRNVLAARSAFSRNSFHQRRRGSDPRRVPADAAHLHTRGCHEAHFGWCKAITYSPRCPILFQAPWS